MTHAIQWNLEIEYLQKVMESLSFAGNMGRNIGKNISENLSSKSSQKPFDHAKQSSTDALKILQKEGFEKQQTQLVI